jgi:ketosteroid isomerase-like protein
MSEQDLEIVRELNRAFNRRDEHWLDLYDAAAEVHIPPGLPGTQVYSGLSGVAQAAALWTEAVDDFHWDLHELIDADDCVVGLFRFRSRLHAHSEWLAPPLGAVFYLREGKITRVLTYFSWIEALQTAGVERLE